MGIGFGSAFDLISGYGSVRMGWFSCFFTFLRIIRIKALLNLVYFVKW
jgi:hypothetical protein